MPAQLRRSAESPRRGVSARLLCVSTAVLCLLAGIGRAQAEQVYVAHASARSHVWARAGAESTQWATASVTVGSDPGFTRTARTSAHAVAYATRSGWASVRTMRRSSSRDGAHAAADRAARSAARRRARAAAYSAALSAAQNLARTRAATEAYAFARKRARLAATLAAAAGATTGTVGTGSGSSGSGSSSAPSCGGEQPAGNWTCSFDDEFDGTSLDRNLWTVQTTAASAFHGGDACAVDDPSVVSVSGGYLDLSAAQTAQPFTCPDPEGDFDTRYTEGTVTTNQGFGQTYGLWKIRARFPDSSVPGLQSALWLWPQDDVRYGPYPETGEIDIAEEYSAFSNLAVPFLHYVSADDDPDVTAQDCHIDTGAFNVYTLLWTPTTMTISVNGSTCLTDTWDSTGPTAGAPFDAPFMINLTEELGIGNNAFDADDPPPLTATMQVDYVRVWRSTDATG